MLSRQNISAEALSIKSRGGGDGRVGFGDGDEEGKWWEAKCFSTNEVIDCSTRKTRDGADSGQVKQYYAVLSVGNASVA